MQAQGRTEYLSENYRNAAKIFQLAARFSGPSAFGEIEGEADAHRVIPHRGERWKHFFNPGERPRHDSKVVNSVSQLLSGTLDDQQMGATKFDFADIGIIYPTHRNREVLITGIADPQTQG